MEDQTLDIKRKALTDLKQFARAEMARDLASRHGKSLRLPWDEDEAAPSEPGPDIDREALEALSGVLGGD